jgi:hypothetical protein
MAISPEEAEALWETIRVFGAVAEEPDCENCGHPHYDHFDGTEEYDACPCEFDTSCHHGAKFEPEGGKDALYAAMGEAARREDWNAVREIQNRPWMQITDSDCHCGEYQPVGGWDAYNRARDGQHD